MGSGYGNDVTAAMAEAALASSEALGWFVAATALAKALAWPMLAAAVLAAWRREFGSALRELPGLLRRLKSGEAGPVKFQLETLPAEPMPTLPPPTEVDPALSEAARKRVLELGRPRTRGDRADR